MSKSIYRLMNKSFEVIGHPPFILWISLILFVTFFGWLITGHNTLFFEIFHLILAIITFIIALVIEGSEKSDTQAIQHKLDEIIRALPQVPNEKAGIENQLKAGEALEDVVKKINRKIKRRK